MAGGFGDLATGDGLFGEIVDLPSGMVGLALVNELGRERRIVYLAADAVTVVMRAEDRPRAALERATEFALLHRALTRDEPEHDR